VESQVPEVMSQARRILVVEDETIVALFIEDLLIELGHEVAGVVSRLEEAMARADDGSFDFAILDVHLAGKEVFPFADALVRRGVTFVFATGYGRFGIPEHLRNRPTLQKPFRPDELADAITKVAAQH
jgi:CheY-like chemotaxis protein